MIKRIKTTDREQWLASRSKYITASDVGAVLGVNPFKSPYEVFLEKTGALAPFSGNAHTERGKRMESEILRRMNNLLGVSAQPNQDIFTNESHGFLAATPDAVSYTGENIDVVYEVKCPAREWSSGAPRYYELQVWAQMVACGASNGVLFASKEDDSWSFVGEYSLSDFDNDTNLKKLSIFHDCCLKRSLELGFW